MRGSSPRKGYSKLLEKRAAQPFSVNRTPWVKPGQGVIIGRPGLGSVKSGLFESFEHMVARRLRAELPRKLPRVEIRRELQRRVSLARCVRRLVQLGIGGRQDKITGRSRVMPPAAYNLAASCERRTRVNPLNEPEH